MSIFASRVVVFSVLPHIIFGIFVFDRFRSILFSAFYIEDTIYLIALSFDITSLLDACG